MTTTILPSNQRSISSDLLLGGIKRTLESTGRLPPISLVITPLDGSDTIYLDRFLTYQFKSSILIPVDTFNFTVSYPDDIPFYERVKDGDIVSLYGNDVPLATGIIDVPETETDGQFGEKVQIAGRDLMSQFEDQDSISIQDQPITAGKYTIEQAVNKLMENTRIRGIRLQDAPKGSYLFATEPGENKLSSLQRFLEPLNCLAWMDANGKIVIGRPNMRQSPKGTIFLIKSDRKSNVLSMKCSRSSTQIANIIVPIWTAQESAFGINTAEPRMYNAAQGPSRLRKLGHRVPKTIVTSTPQGGSAQDLSSINNVVVGGANLLQASAKRELARQNHKELLVQAVVPGHYDQSGNPYLQDSVYRVIYDRGPVDENMYLFDVDYMGSEEGQKSVLHFCRLGTIVSDVKAP